MYVKPLSHLIVAIRFLTMNVFIMDEWRPSKLRMTRARVLNATIAKWTPFGEMLNPSTNFWTKAFNFTQFLRPMLPEVSIRRAMSAVSLQAVTTKRIFKDIKNPKIIKATHCLCLHISWMGLRSTLLETALKFTYLWITYKFYI